MRPTLLSTGSALILAFGVLAFGASRALAQSMDYGALEALFGEPVTVSATGLPQRAGEVPADMEIITQDDIRRSGADNIPDILRFVAGIDVRNYGILSQEVAIRGYSQTPNPRLLVTVNGRQVYIDDYGYAAWSALPVQLEEIRQIEIVKGPNSALFGFNAVSGVINIVTYNPLNDDIDKLSLRTGTQRLTAGAAVTTLRLGETAAVRLSAGGLKARDFDPVGLTPDDIAFRPRPKRGSLNAEAVWQVLPKVQLTAEASIVDTRTAARFGAYFFDMYFRLKSIRAGAVADTAAGVITADYYRNDNKLNYLAFFGPDYIDNSVEVAKVSDLIKLNTTNIVRVGAEYRRNAADGADYGGHLSYGVVSGSAMWEWKPRTTLTVTNAARIDRLDLSYDGTLLPNSLYTVAQYNSTALTALSFNSGVVWTASDFDTVRLTLARGVQAPSLDEFGVQLPGDPPFSGDPTIRPAYSWNVGAAYEHVLADIGGRLRAAVFAQRNEDLLGEVFFANPTVWPNGEQVLQAANIGSSKQVGLELEAEGQLPAGIRWSIGYSFNDISDNIAPRHANAAFSYDRSTPRHAIVLGAGYGSGRWELDGQVRWQSTFQDYKLDPASFERMSVAIGGYVTANARLGYNVTDNLTVALAAQRLTRRRQMQTAGPVSERRVIVSATAGF